VLQQAGWLSVGLTRQLAPALKRYHDSRRLGVGPRRSSIDSLASAAPWVPYPRSLRVQLAYCSIQYSNGITLLYQVTRASTVARSRSAPSRASLLRTVVSTPCFVLAGHGGLLIARQQSMGGGGGRQDGRTWKEMYNAVECSSQGLQMKRSEAPLSI
jgi:hypothetical protein